MPSASFQTLMSVFDKYGVERPRLDAVIPDVVYKLSPAVFGASPVLAERAVAAQADDDLKTKVRVLLRRSDTVTLTG